jgi:cytochrome c-type biogenesis protein CcmE
MSLIQGTGVRPAAPEVQPRTAEPHPSSRARWRLIACIAVVVAALGWIAVRGLTGSFVYYLSPTEVAAQHAAAPGQRIRLGGYVVPGSVHGPAQAMTFTVTDGRTTMSVVSTGAVPELFRAGQGVVVEGTLGIDGRFHSDTLLVKHDGTYRPPSSKASLPARAAPERDDP